MQKIGSDNSQKRFDEMPFSECSREKKEKTYFKKNNKIMQKFFHQKIIKNEIETKKSAK